MKYTPVSQTERQITQFRYQRMQKTFHIVLGLLAICMIILFAGLLFDMAGFLIIPPAMTFWIPQSPIILMQTQSEQIQKQSQQIESEIAQLKALFHEQLIETNKIKAPKIDKNNYEYFTLENGLKVLVIHDVSVQTAQAALCVGAGSWKEPDEFPGLAHFLEHMLFQGSKTYPQEGYFQKMIAEAGGSTNAYTRSEETNYYFKVNNERILEALQVFAHFFIDPLFDENMVDREINAVNSEYEIAVSGDAWKVTFLMQLLSRKPVGRFTIGATSTLQNSLQALKKFHDQYYSASIMSLVVKSNYKDMGKWIREQSDFKQIESHMTKPLPRIAQPLQQTGIYVQYKVNGDRNTVVITYQLESPLKHKKVKALELIANLLQSKHEGGLLDYLVQRQLALNVDSGTFQEGNGEFTFFLIEVSVLDTDPFKVAQAVIGYFSTMLEDFFSEIDHNEITSTPYLEDLWNSQKQLALAQFNYLDKSKEPSIQKLAHNLNTFDYKDVESIDFLYEEFNAEIIYNYLSELVNPSNMIILQGSSKYTNLRSKSEIYRLEYEINNINEEQMSMLTSVISTSSIKLAQQKAQHITLGMKLPLINTYIAKNFDMKTLCYDTSFIQSPLIFKSKEDCIQHEHDYESLNHYPHIIKRNKETKAWWKLQRGFQVPQVFAGLLFNTPKTLISLKDKTLSQFINQIVTETLNKQLQDAINAGYQFSFSSTIKGVSIEMLGWSDNFSQFFQDILKSVEQFNLDQFEQISQRLLLKYNNLYQDKLFKVTMQEYLNEVMIPSYYPPNYFIQEIKSVTRESLLEFKNDYFQNFRVTSLFTGNILRGEVDTLLNEIKSVFYKSSHHVVEDNQSFTVRDLKGKSIVVPMQHKGSNENDNNGVTLNYYQIGRRNKKVFAIMNILQSFMHNRAFQYLRTERQLGYVALMRFMPLGCIDGAAIIVQGTTQPPYVVNRHIDDFVKQFYTILKNLPDDQFEQLKFGAKSALQDQDKSLLEESSYMWSHIKNNNIVLEEREIAIALIDELSLADAVEFYQKTFLHKNGRMSLQVYGKGVAAFDQVEQNLLKNEEIIDLQTLSEFKCTYSLSNI